MLGPYSAPMLESLLAEALTLLMLSYYKEKSSIHKSPWSYLLLNLHQNPILVLCLVSKKSFFHVRSRSCPAPTRFLHSLSEEKAANVSGLMLLSERGSPIQTLTLPLQIPWRSFQWKLKSPKEIVLDKTWLHLVHTAECCSVSDTVL